MYEMFTALGPKFAKKVGLLRFSTLEHNVLVLGFLKVSFINSHISAPFLSMFIKIVSITLVFDILIRLVKLFAYSVCKQLNCLCYHIEIVYIVTSTV